MYQSHVHPNGRRPWFNEMAVWPGNESRVAPRLTLRDTPANYQIHFADARRSTRDWTLSVHDRGLVLTHREDGRVTELAFPVPVWPELISHEQDGDVLVITIPKMDLSRSRLRFERPTGPFAAAAPCAL